MSRRYSILFENVWKKRLDFMLEMIYNKRNIGFSLSGRNKQKNNRIRVRKPKGSEAPMAGDRWVYLETDMLSVFEKNADDSWKFSGAYFDTGEVCPFLMIFQKMVILSMSSCCLLSLKTKGTKLYNLPSQRAVASSAAVWILCWMEQDHAVLLFVFWNISYFYI